MDALAPLIDFVAQQPEDLGRWAVLADALLEAGDVRGEWMVMDLERRGVTARTNLNLWRDRTRSVKDLVRAHRAELFGPFAPAGGSDFAFGAPTVASLTMRDADVNDVLLWRWSALIQRLHMTVQGAGEMASFVELAARSSVKWLRALRLHATDSLDLVGLARVWPGLRELTVGADDAEPLEVSWPELRSLTLMGQATEVAPFLRAPNLELLSLAAQDGVSTTLLREACAVFPAVATLSIDGLSIDELLRFLLASPWAKTLVTLVGTGGVRRKTLEWLVEQRAHLPRLRHVTFRGGIPDGAQWPHSERDVLKRMPGLRITS